MRVRCKPVPDERPWLTPGEEYVVLTVEVFLHRPRIEYRLHPFHGGGPALFSAAQFEVISNEIPPSWRIRVEADRLTLAPEAWMQSGFWEDFFDGDLAAERVFRDECDKILGTATGAPT